MEDETIYDSGDKPASGVSASADAPLSGVVPAHADAPLSGVVPARTDTSASDAVSACADDECFMRLALAQARRAAKIDEVPIGAVVVSNGVVIARGYNRREVDEDPAGHAEFIALKRAAKKLGHWRLTGCTVYVTLEPCLMCAGLMYQARVDRCVYGAADPKAGALGTLYRINEDGRLNHNFKVTPGILANECAQMLKDFFKQRRK